MNFQNYSFNYSLSSVKVCSTSNVEGFYWNGMGNNGVGATITLSNPFVPLVIDGITISNKDQVLLNSQTNQNENGIYFFNDGVLTRREDFHNIEQIRAGQYLSVANGVANKGIIFTVVDPLPLNFGIDPLIITASTKLLRDFSVELNTTTPGVYFAVNANLIDSQIINEAGAFIAAFNGRTFIEGITLAQATIGLRGGIFATGGTYTPSSGIIAGVYSSLNFQDLSGTTTINGANVFAYYGVYEFPFDVNTDVSNFSMMGLVNPQIETIGQMMYFDGKATQFMKIVDASSTYTANAGTGVGSAGDPTKCNAARVIKVLVNNVLGYIPLFNTNA